MARFEPRSSVGHEIAASESATATFGQFEYYSALDLHVKGTLATGASVVFSVEVSVDGTNWYDTKFVSLQGADDGALVASVTQTDSFALSLIRVVPFAPYVRVVMDNGAGAREATIDMWAVAVVE